MFLNCTKVYFKRIIYILDKTIENVQRLVINMRYCILLVEPLLVTLAKHTTNCAFI